MSRYGSDRKAEVLLLSVIVCAELDYASARPGSVLGRFHVCPISFRR